jgi:hypothetical protein
MAVQIEATMPRTFDGGMTAREIVEGFVTVQTSGAREVARRLEEMALRAMKDPNQLLQRAVIAASRPLAETYKSRINTATGNLQKSIKTRPGKKKYEGVAIAVTGPLMTGNGGASEKDGSGNHAWLVEFGTGRRRPGTQGRRTYLNVHQMINGKFSRVSNKGRPFDNSQFERMGRGYYFLMGSKNEPTRQRRSGSGYPHDFLPDGKGGTHPYFLESGDTYGAMPPQHAMEKSIASSSQAVLNLLITTMQRYIDEL